MEEGYERRRGSIWLPYAAVAISLVSMVLGPCFGAVVAVVGNYVTKQSDAAVAAEQRRQDSDKLRVIGEKVDEIFKQNAARAVTETRTSSDIEHLKTDLAKESSERAAETGALRRDVDENLKILNTYAAKVEGSRRK